MLYQSTSVIYRWIIPWHGGKPDFMKAEVPGIGPTEVGGRIRLTREALGLGQEEFGRPAGMSKQAISNIEAGHNYPTIPNLVGLSEAHDIALPWLLTGTFKGLRYELVEAIKQVVTDRAKGIDAKRRRSRSDSAVSSRK